LCENCLDTIQEKEESLENREEKKIRVRTRQSILGNDLPASSEGPNSSKGNLKRGQLRGKNKSWVHRDREGAFPRSRSIWEERGKRSWRAKPTTRKGGEDGQVKNNGMRLEIHEERGTSLDF